MAEIRLESVRKTFGKVVATDDVSLTIHDREFMVLLGPSGCGKTTLLRGIAGLEQIERGRIFIGDRDVTDLPPRKRRIAMVFQSYAVFPHLTVFDNIAFGLRMQRTPDAELKKRVHAAAELLKITELLKRYPAQVSGGQRQRVAVARALAVPSDVLLMDEPLSNLDALLRLEMRAELKRLLKEVNATVVYVTHDQIEALSLGDRIAVMDVGRIVQCDTPLKVYDEPASEFVGRFIGNPPMNFLEGQASSHDGNVVVTAGGLALQPPPSVQASLSRAPTTPVRVGIRAENIEAHASAAAGALQGTVLVVEPLGSHNLLTVQVGAEQVKVNVHPDAAFQSGQPIWLRLAPDKIRWMNGENGRRFEA
ncbi:MAG: sugar ABC transporter ATP-binding protein [Candidatus Roseilinea sp.]|nr:MAG: sugar ABC transporter ATP-binding protein [Candidatus Roseilinea sp.]